MRPAKWAGEGRLILVSENILIHSYLFDFLGLCMDYSESFDDGQMRRGGVQVLGRRRETYVPTAKFGSTYFCLPEPTLVQYSPVSDATSSLRSKTLEVTASSR